MTVRVKDEKCPRCGGFVKIYPGVGYCRGKDGEGFASGCGFFSVESETEKDKVDKT